VFRYYGKDDQTSMIEDFNEACRRYFDSCADTLSGEQMKQNLRFAMSNRQRGEDFIQTLKGDTGFDMDGAGVLDVGSAYGGFVIQCAKHGAHASGVEIVKKFHELALINAQGEPGSINLVHGNILDNSILRGKTFDALIFNDVFEHIFDVEHLFHRIDALSKLNSIVYFAIPNGESYHSILKEGHKFIFGLTLLEPGNWGSVVGNFNIYYRPLDLYRYYFGKAGFNHVYLMVNPDEVKEAPDRVKMKYKEIENLLQDDSFENPGLNNQARIKFQLLKQKLDRDLSRSNPLILHLKYEQYFWIGYGSRKKINSPNLIEIGELS